MLSVSELTSGVDRRRGVRARWTLPAALIFSRTRQQCLSPPQCSVITGPAAHRAVPRTSVLGSVGSPTVSLHRWDSGVPENGSALSGDFQPSLPQRVFPSSGSSVFVFRGFTGSLGRLIKRNAPRDTKSNTCWSGLTRSRGSSFRSGEVFSRRAAARRVTDG